MMVEIRVDAPSGNGSVPVAKGHSASPQLLSNGHTTEKRHAIARLESLPSNGSELWKRLSTRHHIASRLKG